jgi:phage gpG-like protein
VVFAGLTCIALFTPITSDKTDIIPQKLGEGECMGVVITGMNKIADALTRVEKVAKSPQQIMGEHIARPIYNTIIKAYSGEKDPVTGAKWTPLSAKTLKLKKGKGKILLSTDALQSKTVWQVSEDTAFVGTSAKAHGYAYPAVHQFGSTNGKIPQRRFIPIMDNGDLETELAEKIEKALVKKFEGLL